VLLLPAVAATTATAAAVAALTFHQVNAIGPLS